MVVTDYHVQSVLRTYIRQLQKSRLAAAFGGGERAERSEEEKVTISEEARRRLIRDRVTSQVLEKQGYEEISNPPHDHNRLGAVGERS